MDELIQCFIVIDINYGKFILERHLCKVSLHCHISYVTLLDPVNVQIVE